VSATGALFPSLIPGANTSGSNVSTPQLPYEGPGQSMGGPVNPFMMNSTPNNMGVGFAGTPVSPGSGWQPNPGLPGGGFQPAASNSTGSAPTFGANQSPYPTANPTGSAPGGSLGTSLGFGSGPVSGNQNPFHNVFTTGENQLLSGFLSSGAGFNQQAINNLIAAMQPGFQQSQQNLLEQFSATGNRFGSAAGIGLSNLESQQNLQIGALESQMYEQSVQNYLDILTGSMGAAYQGAHQPSLLAGILGGVGQAAGGILGGLGMVGL
jgi:hypothetical protein